MDMNQHSEVFLSYALPSASLFNSGNSCNNSQRHPSESWRSRMLITLAGRTRTSERGQAIASIPPMSHSRSASKPNSGCDVFGHVLNCGHKGGSYARSTYTSSASTTRPGLSAGSGSSVARRASPVSIATSRVTRGSEDERRVTRLQIVPSRFDSGHCLHWGTGAIR